MKWTVYYAAEKDWAFRLNPVFGRLNYDDILIMFVGLNFGTIFESIWGEIQGYFL